MTSSRKTPYVVAAIALASALATALLVVGTLPASGHDSAGDPGAIVSPADRLVVAPFDLVRTRVDVDDGEVTFRSHVVGRAGSIRPKPVGGLDGAGVYSYVWPTTLDSADIGFAAGQGIVALAATSHPDFDDTPLYDENRDGDRGNDGIDWHAHWVVLAEDSACSGGLKVRELPEGERPVVPGTWPGLPIQIDSPGYRTTLHRHVAKVRVPVSHLPDLAGVRFDGVTAGLRVSTSPHDPLLCVSKVVDLASGDLSLPGAIG